MREEPGRRHVRDRVQDAVGPKVAGSRGCDVDEHVVGRSQVGIGVEKANTDTNDAHDDGDDCAEQERTHGRGRVDFTTAWGSRGEGGDQANAVKALRFEDVFA